MNRNRRHKRINRDMDFSMLSKAAKQDLAGFTGDQYAGFVGPTGGRWRPPAGTKEYILNLTVANIAGIHTLIIMPGVVWNETAPANGVIREAAVLSEFPDAEGVASVFTCAGSPKTTDYFLHFLRNVPGKFLGFKIKSTDADQLEKQFFISKESAFTGQDKEMAYSLGSFTTEMAQNDKMVTVPFSDQMDNQTKFSIQLVANTTVTITMFIGELDNIPAEFAGD